VKQILRTFIATLCLISVAPVTTASAADYYPLAAGNKWTYSLEMEGSTGTLKDAIEKKIVNGTDTVFRMSSKIAIIGYNDSSSGYVMSNGNDVFYFESLNDAKPYDKTFEHQPIEGHTWTLSTGEAIKIVYYGSFTVPAGTFNSCYAILVDSDTSEIYAPDVGLIAMLSEGTVTALTSYTVVPSSPVIFTPERASGNRFISKTGIHAGLYQLINLQGRRSDIAAVDGYYRPDRTLSPGSYFLLDKEMKSSGMKSAIRMCVIGR
jgi:hypothetical protein